MLLDQIHLALKRIKDRLQESIMVILGLGFGIAVVTTVLCILSDFNSLISNQSDSEWMRNIYVYPKEYSNSSNNSSIQKIGNRESPKINFTLDYLNDIKKICPTIDYAYFRLWINMEPDSNEEFSENTSWWQGEMGAMGITEDYLPFIKMNVGKGSNFSADDYENGRNVLIIGGNLAKKLFHDKNPVGLSLNYNNMEYKVIGVLEENYENSTPSQIEDRKENRWDNNNRIYLPYTSVQNYREWFTIDSMIFGVKHGVDLSKAVKEIRSYLARDYPHNEVAIESSLDWNSNNDSFIQVLTVIGFISLISLVIATLNNLNLMLARVLRQRKGMGISIALGSTKIGLFKGVFIESILLGIMGALLGTVLAFIFSHFTGKLLSSFDTFAAVNMSIKNLLISIGLSLLLTAIFSIYPGIEATKTNTTLVLRED